MTTLWWSYENKR